MIGTFTVSNAFGTLSGSVTSNSRAIETGVAIVAVPQPTTISSTPRLSTALFKAEVLGPQQILLALDISPKALKQETREGAVEAIHSQAQQASSLLKETLELFPMIHG